jgi:phosphoribosylaminoimidazole-succinocarboxamide synthase
MGSVKDLRILKPATESSPGLGEFVFSDRYSVFDWGEMPDHITDKGAAICIATAHFFEKLEKEGVPTHFIGLVEDGKAKRLNELSAPSHVMRFRMVRVIKPELRGSEFDYSVFKTVRSNFLIPLEVIFRNSLPAGSSVFKRLKNGSLKLEDLGLNRSPVPGQILENPILDVSTKLENIDRYITWDEAREISGMTDDEMKKMKQLTLDIDQMITDNAAKLGLRHEDGKIEFGFNEEREFMLVDALGTLDECRFTYEGIPVSKEIARIYYRKTDWYREVEEAKKKDSIRWKELVKSRPEKLPGEFAEAIANVYRAYANELTGREWFKTPPLADVLKTIKEYLEIE